MGSDDLGHEPYCQQDEQQDGQTYTNTERNNGSLGLAAVLHEVVETAAEADDNAEHHKNYQEI